MFGPLVELIECQDLYNVLNEGIDMAKINDLHYLYLLDCRTRKEYNESHIITAKNIKMADENFLIPFESELHCRNLIVVYDSNTSSLQENGLAMKLAKLLSESGSKFSIKILKGGYETFSKFYPFLRSQQIIYMPKERLEIKTYPSEIIPGLLYLGNSFHANQAYIRKDLKLKSFVDCSKSVEEDENSKENTSIDFFRVDVKDEPDASIQSHLKQVCNFIDVNVRNRKRACLVYSDLGISRSAAIIIAYLVFSEKITVQEAFEKTNKCRKVQPQTCFLHQIEQEFNATKEN